MFEMHEEKEPLMIVVDKETTKFGSYLMQLISENNKDIDASCVSYEEYRGNKPTVSSDQKIVFIGNNKFTEDECPYVDTKFNICGMSYGWRGSRAILSVDKKPLSIMEYTKFLKTFGDSLTYKPKDFRGRSIKWWAKTFLTSVTISAVAAREILLHFKEIRQQQYEILTSKFHTNGLKKFMEG